MCKESFAVHVQMMFDSNIGFLPLSFMGHVDCKTNGELFVPDDQILQMYAMLTRSMCPPEGYSAAFEGQFVVSRKRILANDWWVYRHLLVSLQLFTHLKDPSLFMPSILEVISESCQGSCNSKIQDSRSRSLYPQGILGFSQPGVRV